MHEEFARFSEILPDPLLLLNGKGTVLAANSAAAAFLGYSKQELGGRPLAGLAQARPEQIEALLRAFGRTRQAVPGALVFVKKDGTASPCRCEGGLYRERTADGQPPLILVRMSCKDEPGNRFIALNRQIGELSSEIRRRTRAEAELYRQRERFRVTLAGIGDAVIATCREGLVTFINPAACSLTGWTEQEALDRPLGEVFHIVNEETRAPVESPIARVLGEGVVAGLANHTVLIRRDGTAVPIDDSGAPIRDESGTLIGAVLVFHDITERRRLERELKQKAKALEDMNRRKDEFLAMLSHELRNPLAPLRNCITIFEKKGETDGTSRRLLEIMSRQVSHLTRLIDDLLDVSRVTTGRIHVIKEDVPLDRTVARAVEAVQPLLDARKQRLEVELRRLRIVGDEARLTQIFINLLENASKYTPEDGSIRVRMRCDGDHATVAIEDTGIGIEPDVLRDIFELFIQADNALDRAHGGLGVGLALVRTLVELHGGTVTASSPGRGRGSTFTVALPTGGS